MSKRTVLYKVGLACIVISIAGCVGVRKQDASVSSDEESEVTIDQLWEMPGDQIEAAVRAWTVVEKIKPGVGLRQYFVRYVKDSNGGANVYFEKRPPEDLNPGDVDIPFELEVYGVDVSNGGAKLFYSGRH